MADLPLTWNPKLGLCRQDGPGHIKEVLDMNHVHVGSISMLYLCMRVQHRAITPQEVLVTLKSLRHMQVLDGGSHHGCMSSYYEEKGTADTNAAFFIGLSLQMLYLNETAWLGEEVRAAIRKIVTDLSVWFEHELTSEDGNPRYPNKCLGDLVAGWLAVEVLDRPASDQLYQTTQEWCAYWRDQHWGWGEHMSDAYTMICLTELSAVLLYCPSLPKAIRADFQSLFDELIELSDSFGWGARVPTIRCYGFEETPRLYPFRDSITATPAGADEVASGQAALVARSYVGVFGSWFYRAGWDKIVKSVQPVKPWMEIPCYGDSVARAMVKPQIRIGAMSHYPIMEGVDHFGWGLSWQTFPAALWRAAGDWGFWRWTTRRGDFVRAHPAIRKSDAFSGNGLSNQMEPPPIPRMTSKLTPEGKLTMERMLPIPDEADWDEVSDSFCLLDSDAKITAEEAQLTLRWPDAAVVVKWLGDGVPEWQPAANGGNWIVSYDRQKLADTEMLTHRWELTLNTW